VSKKRLNYFLKPFLKYSFFPLTIILRYLYKTVCLSMQCAMWTLCFSCTSSNNCSRFELQFHLLKKLKMRFSMLIIYTSISIECFLVYRFLFNCFGRHLVGMSFTLQVVDIPLYTEIRYVLLSAGLSIGVEVS